MSVATATRPSTAPARRLSQNTAGTTPGAYMKQRRQRAGLTIVQCAEQIAFSGSDRLKAKIDLVNLEGDSPGNYLRLVQHLEARSVFSFEMSVFLNLAAATTDTSLEMDVD